MSDSDGDYVEQMSGDDHEAEFNATESPLRTRHAGSRKTKAAPYDGRYRPSHKRAPALAAWEGKLQDPKARGGTGADADRAVDLSRVLEARKRAG
jgi:hypothetical protein